MRELFDWKYLSVEGNQFLYDLSRDSRERANMRYREPEKFAELRDAYLEWDRSMPPIPEDAKYDLVYTDDTMAKSAGWSRRESLTRMLAERREVSRMITIEVIGFRRLGWSLTAPAEGSGSQSLPG